MDSIKVRNSTAPITDMERRNVLLQRANDPAFLRHAGLPSGQSNPDMFSKIGRPLEFGSNATPRNSGRRLA